MNKIKSIFSCCLTKDPEFKNEEFTSFFQDKDNNDKGSFYSLSKKENAIIDPQMEKKIQFKSHFNLKENIELSTVSNNYKYSHKSSDFLTSNYVTNDLIKSKLEETHINNIKNSKNSFKNENILNGVNVEKDNGNIKAIVNKKEPYIKNLILEEIEGNSILGGQIIEINNLGMINGYRNSTDGVTYFGVNNTNLLSPKVGLKNLVSDLNLNSFSPIDFGLNIDNYKNHNNVLFKISFNSKNNFYYISQFCNETVDNTIIFFKIEKEFQINRKHIISLGEINIKVNVDEKKTLFIEVNLKNEVIFSREFPNNQNSVIRIGRSKENEIPLDFTTFSRVQLSFYYNSKDSCWILKDGYENKKSKNGTWLYLDWEWKIVDDTYFRIGNSFFKLRLI